MKRKKIEKEYNEMLKKTEEWLKDLDLTNRANNYVCQSCGHVTKTKDVDKGVTPFIHSCKLCGGEAYSTFYNDYFPNHKATQEWYRPSLDETLEMDEMERHHVLQGGLIPRKIKEHGSD